MSGLLDPGCPVIQAPMAGGATTPALVAAVSRAGAIGAIGAAYLTPEAIRAAVAAVRATTDRPFAINLFAGGHATATAVDAAPMLGLLAADHDHLGLQRPVLPAWPTDLFGAQFEAVLELRPAVFSVTFGLPHDAFRRARAAGMEVWGTATTVAEARALEAAGATAVIAQGAEAGGHRGTFAGPFEAAMVGTIALVPQVVDAIRVPVIASGGIMDGRGIAAALALGACGAQMGTAFLATVEAGIPPAYKAALATARDDATRLTTAFSGRPARGLVNAFMETVDRAGAALPYPLQNALTRPMRTEAARQDDADRLSLWAGQAAAMSRHRAPAIAAAALVAALRHELAAARALLSPVG